MEWAQSCILNLSRKCDAGTMIPPSHTACTLAVIGCRSIRFGRRQRAVGGRPGDPDVHQELLGRVDVVVATRPSAAGRHRQVRHSHE